MNTLTMLEGIRNRTLSPISTDWGVTTSGIARIGMKHGAARFVEVPLAVSWKNSESACTSEATRKHCRWRKTPSTTAGTSYVPEHVRRGHRRSAPREPISSLPDVWGTRAGGLAGSNTYPDQRKPVPHPWTGPRGTVLRNLARGEDHFSRVAGCSPPQAGAGAKVMLTPKNTFPRTTAGYPSTGT